MSDDRNIFIKALADADSLPLAVQERATAVQSLERTTFDASYLDFLREQIRLAARGSEWTAILTDRLAALSPYCDKPTLRGTITTETGLHFVRVDPASGVVIHHEFNEAAPGNPS
jgi:hypothetical protein